MEKYKFGTKSKEILQELIPPLKVLCEEVIKISRVDFALTCGYRTPLQQQLLYAEGKSKIDGKTKLSNHNMFPSKAVDIVVCNKQGKQDFTKEKELFYLLGLFEAKANELQINIRFGAWWDNQYLEDNNFIDAFHIEIV